MKRFTFLPSEIFYPLVVLWAYSFLNWNLGYKILISLLTIILLFAFRRASIPYRDTLKNDGEIYLSPVHGTVESIRRDTTTWEEYPYTHEVRISISGWGEKGLYLPTAGEVSYLKASKGKKVPRDSELQEFYAPIGELAHTDFILTSKKSDEKFDAIH